MGRHQIALDRAGAAGSGELPDLHPRAGSLCQFPKHGPREAPGHDAALRVPGPVQGEGGEEPPEGPLTPQDDHPHTLVGFNQQARDAAGGDEKVSQDQRLSNAPDVGRQVVHVRRCGGPSSVSRGHHNGV
eukprot:11187192-Alexandrium_andersonii.AAC.1